MILNNMTILYHHELVLELNGLGSQVINIKSIRHYGNH